MNCIIGRDNWLKIYSQVENRRKVWIYVLTSDDKEIYLPEYDDWLNFQEYIDKYNVTIKQIGLQYKSNLVQQDASKAEAVYLVRSAKGELHSDTLQCYTLGFLNDGEVKKTFYISPSLVPDIKCVDSFESCFKEAFVYNVRQGKTI